MLTVLLLISVGLACVQGNCSPCARIPAHLEELQCTGSTDKAGDCCPIKFDCPKIELSPDSCWVNGKSYKVGEEVPTSASGPCRHCICSEGFDGSPGRLNCAHTECPEGFSGGPILLGAPKCINQYSVDECCRVGEVCGDEIETLATCHYRGQNATRGSKIYPEDDVCYQCVCNEHFVDDTKASAQPKACRKINCAIDLDLNEAIKFCAPVYYKDRCCPSSWLCPKDDVKVISDKPSTRPHLECKFGSTAVKYGDGVEVDDKCTTCSCQNPPYLTCTKDSECERASFGI